MRTTIEISEELRQRLVNEAARTGRKGFSHIVEAALWSYFGGTLDSDSRTRLIDELYGAEANDNDLSGTIRGGNWRTGGASE